MSAPALLRVTAFQNSRRRAGFAFTREPVDLLPDDLGEGFAGMVRLVQLLEDPQLKLEVVEDDEVRALTDEEREAIFAMAKACEAEVDPADPPAVITELLGTDAGSTAKPKKKRAATKPDAPQPDGPKVASQG